MLLQIKNKNENDNIMHPNINNSLILLPIHFLNVFFTLFLKYT